MRSLSAGSAPEAARGTHSIRDFLPQHARGAARAGGQLSLNGIASLHTPHTTLCTLHSALCTPHSALRTLHFYLLFTLGVDELAAAAAPPAPARQPPLPQRLPAAAPLAPARQPPPTLPSPPLRPPQPPPPQRLPATTSTTTAAASTTTTTTATAKAPAKVPAKGKQQGKSRCCLTTHYSLRTPHSALRTPHFYLLFTLGVDELAAAAAPLASAKAPANGKQQVTSRWEVAPPMTQMELLLRLAAEGRRKVPSTSLHPFTPHSLFLTPHSSLFKGHHTFLTHHRMHQTATGAGGSRTARGAGGS